MATTYEVNVVASAEIDQVDVLANTQVYQVTVVADVLTGGIGIQSVTGDGVDNTDPLNPVLTFPTTGQIIEDVNKNFVTDADLVVIGNTSGVNTGDQTFTSDDGSVVLTEAGSNTDLSVVFSESTSNVLVAVRNSTGATLLKGTVVYITGATGQISTVSKAIAVGDATSAQTLGLITADLNNNSNGTATIIGLISNINTSAFSDGDQLYLSATVEGAFTNVKQYAPNHLVYIGIVEYAHPNHGKIFVKVQNGYELDELHNVSAKTPSNRDSIIYNSTTELWEQDQVTKSDVGLSNVPNLDTSTTSNITDSVNKRFVTDADLVVIGNTSGVNTGDQDISGIGVNASAIEALKIVQITGVEVLSASFSLVSGLWESDISNANILSDSSVEVIPENSTITIVESAIFLPQTISVTGSVKVFAKNQPTGSIFVTLNISKTL